MALNSLKALGVLLWWCAIFVHGCIKMSVTQNASEQTGHWCCWL